ncbi:DUF924 domain-containing protein [filamentous cyanobacterium LEGE 11480]|uniref:DUF924 domain-containing protein n=1 Tax=Romeriopsis navalis LEGE 11480 TaxID=2777977 RepID=A0A928VTY6_9CYAN|nr:DUF924 family protein [Romeriopsis navalis]MBE9033011.1 DUF924 domain-containing protein [Romeriopsis navalis LEGE 11480]
MGHGEKVLQFWFGEDFRRPDLKPQKKWFIKDDIFDQSVREWFSGVYQQATEGRFEDWMETAEGALALTIVLDQFPRNMFRDTPKAFASDAQALMVASQAIDRDFDQDVSPVMRVFFYVPFEHSENLANQHRCVELFQSLATEPALKSYPEYALKHQAVIKQFGRFPHRNEILGRTSTPEELTFLQQPGSRF